MTCRLLLHLFRAPQACLVPHTAGEWPQSRTGVRSPSFPVALGLLQGCPHLLFV